MSKIKKKAKNIMPVDEKPTEAIDKNSIEDSEDNATSNEKKTRRKKINAKKLLKYILVILGIAGILYGVYRYKGVLVAATVNGMPISRIEVITELEKQGGNQVLSGIIRKKLLEAEAKKKNISVTQKDLDEKFKEIDAQFQQSGQSLDQYLTSMKLSKDDFMKDQLRYEVLLNKLVADKIKVDDKEVENYIEQNKDQYKDKNMDDVKKEVTEMMKQNKLRMETSTYLEELVSKAKVDYFSYQK